MDELVLVVNIRVKADRVAQFMEEVERNGKAARETEPGCLQFDILQDREDPTKVLLYEVYADAAAFEAHQQTAHFRHYLEHGLQHLESRERTFFRRARP